MDRYGACTGGFESDDDSSYDHPRHGAPLYRDVDYGHGCVDGGERSGRNHRSYDDEDTDFGRYDRPTRRGLADRCGTDPYASDASIEDHEYEPRNRNRGRAGRVRGGRPRHRDLTPDSFADDEDSESEHAGREIWERRFRRGALSYHSDRRFDGEYSDDDSDSGPHAMREGRSGPRLRRGAEHHRHPRLRSSVEDSEDESDGSPRERYGPGGRRSMAASYAGCRGTAHDSSTDDDSECEGMRGGRRVAPRFGGSSRREFY